MLIFDNISRVAGASAAQHSDRFLQYPARMPRAARLTVPTTELAVLRPDADGVKLLLSQFMESCRPGERFALPV